MCIQCMDLNRQNDLFTHNLSFKLGLLLWSVENWFNQEKRKYLISHVSYGVLFKIWKFKFRKSYLTKLRCSTNINDNKIKDDFSYLSCHNHKSQNKHGRINFLMFLSFTLKNILPSYHFLCVDVNMIWINIFYRRIFFQLICLWFDAFECKASLCPTST